MNSGGDDTYRRAHESAQNRLYFGTKPLHSLYHRRVYDLTAILPVRNGQA